MVRPDGVVRPGGVRKYGVRKEVVKDPFVPCDSRGYADVVL